ncbi:MAG TPA: hypothetical protein VI199_08870 [Novosphingobium sp.]
MAKSRIRFDSNRAWQQAMAALRSNRDMLLPLAGVFFLLPNLAMSILVPEPKPPSGADQAAMMAFAMDYYRRVLPVVVPVVLFQATGTLGMLTLLTDRSRPTVGQALMAGLRAVLPYFGSQLVFGFVLGIVAMPLLILASLTRSAAVTVLTLIVLGVVGWTRTALAAPVIAIEKERNPVRALARSWLLTRGNTLAILGFTGLITLVFLVVMWVVMALGGTLATLLLPPQGVTIVSAVLSATLGALMVLVLVAALAAIHDQLADGGERG